MDPEDPAEVTFLGLAETALTLALSSFQISLGSVALGRHSHLNPGSECWGLFLGSSTWAGGAFWR